MSCSMGKSGNEAKMKYFKVADQCTELINFTRSIPNRRESKTEIK